MTQHEITTRDTWLLRRKELLAREKAFMKEKDALAEARRALPWVRVEKDYRFDGVRGQESLGELFAGRSQLLVYHFMFGPSAEVGCKSCSFWADHFDGALSHLAQRDVSFVAISRGPLAKLMAFRQRLGWRFPWLSSAATDFNYDFSVSFRDEERASGTLSYNYGPLTGRSADLPGLSAFYRDPSGAIFHTYSTYGRGIELANATYQLLDLAPKGRDEDRLPQSMAWVRFHDEYPHSA